MIAIGARRGELIDISFGGLAFHYTGSTPWPDESAGAAMLCGADDFCLHLPTMMVSDVPLESALAGKPASIMRRCGLRFGELNASQLIQLIAFIRDNTLDQEIPEIGTMMPSA